MSSPAIEVNRPSKVSTLLDAIIMALHLAMVVLVGLGMIRIAVSGVTGPVQWAGLITGAVLLALYLLGARWRSDAPERAVGSAMGDRFRTRIWLAAVTTIWVAALVASPDYAWVGFPLFFWHLQLLTRWHAIVAIVLMTIAIIVSPVLHHRPFEVGSVLGPVIGAVFAVLTAMAYETLRDEVIAHRAALAELRRTRDELAAAQHEAGRTAERERLATEIHDTIAQGLSSIVLLSRAAGRDLPEGSARGLVRQVEDVASDNLSEARRLVRDLVPGEEDPGLLASLTTLAERAEGDARALGHDTTVGVEAEQIDLGPVLEQTLVRAAQVAVTNAVRHAEAGRIMITVTPLDDEVVLDVVDDGVGFDAVRRGFGLTGLERRVRGLGGQVQIESAPGEGTAVAVRLHRRAATVNRHDEGDTDD